MPVKNSRNQRKNTSAPQKIETLATPLRPLLSPSNATLIREYALELGASPTSVVNIALRQWLNQQTDI